MDEPTGGTPLDPQHLRISDGDRDKVVDVLREAAGDGRIDLAELDERLAAAYAARTYADLAPLTHDLPGAGAGVVPRTGAALTRRTPAGIEPRHQGSYAMMSETRRAGVWDIGATHTAAALMGSVVLDLRQARFAAGHEVVITANAVMGSIEIVVGPDTPVQVDGIAVMGSFTEHGGGNPEHPDPAVPTLRVRGVAFWGSVEVRRKDPSTGPALPGH